MPLGIGTTELVLPGLDDAGGTMSDPQPGHWIERGPSKRLMVFAGRSHPSSRRRSQTTSGSSSAP